MIIQLNTDKNIAGDEWLERYLNTLIKNEQLHFSDHITSIEVHLADENSQKNGQNNKRCMLEASLKNRQLIAVTSKANTVVAAVNDALEKLKASLQP